MLEYLEFLTKMLDERKAVDVLYLNFAKAFNKVPHKRILRAGDWWWRGWSWLG